jgi:hypothetical protein
MLVIPLWHQSNFLKKIIKLKNPAKAFEEDTKITKPNRKIAEQIKNLKIKLEGTKKDTVSKVVSELKRILVSDRAENVGNNNEIFSCQISHTLSGNERCLEAAK